MAGLKGSKQCGRHRGFPLRMPSCPSASRGHPRLNSIAAKQDVDARHKAVHDGVGARRRLKLRQQLGALPDRYRCFITVST